MLTACVICNRGLPKCAAADVCDRTADGIVCSCAKNISRPISPARHERFADDNSHVYGFRLRVHKRVFSIDNVPSISRLPAISFAFSIFSYRRAVIFI